MAFSVGEALTYGWRGFVNNLGPLALIALVVLAANIVTSIMTGLFDNAFLDLLLVIGSMFISLVINLGLIRAALALVDGRRPEVGDLVSARDIGPYILASLLVAITVTVGIILCVIPGLIAAFLLQFYGYAIIDRKVDELVTAPQSDPIGAIRASFDLVSRNVGDLLALGITCLVLNLLGAILCGVGLLVTLPVTGIAIAYAWRYFSGGRIAAQQS